MNKRDIILEAALKLVNREGFYHLSMKKLAQEAGVAAGTTYLYFDSKEKLINELYIKVANDFKSAVLKDYDKTKNFREIFFGLLGNAIRFYVNNPDCFSFIEQYTYSPFLFKETQEENFLILEPIYQLAKEAKKRKEIKELPEALVVALAFGPVTSMMKLHLSGKTDLSKKSSQEKLIQACWENIIPSGKEK